MKTDLVGFQQKLFAQIDSQKQIDEERLCLRAFAGAPWLLDTNDIVYVSQVPAKYTIIPKADPAIKGLVQHDGEVYSVFDLGLIITGQPTAATKSNRILLLQSGIAQGTAFLVEYTPSLLPVSSFSMTTTENIPYAFASLIENDSEAIWNWLDLKTLLEHPIFLNKRAELAYKDLK